MRRIDKKLIVSDFDCTLLTGNQIIPDSVRSAINEYVACGGIFAVCTGRMLRSILPRVRELGLKGLVVAYQGTVIAEIESGKIIKKGAIEYSSASEVCAYIEEQRGFEKLAYGINAYSEEILYTDIPKDNEHLKLYERITGVEAESAGIDMSEFISKNKLCCQKIACLVPPELRESLYLNLLGKFGSKFDVTCSAQVLVEVSPLNDNKGEALKFIASHYGVSMDSTVAVGDNLNDLPMIKQAGVGVAVGNAVQELKDAADIVTVSNNDGAVAKIIEKYGFR